MSSSPEGADAAHRSPTEQIWDLHGQGLPAVPYAAAMLGLDVGTLSDALSLSLATSPEAAALLDGMEVRIRTLPTGFETVPEHCVSSVRGPIMWVETITARANALGNDDVFVCMAAGRSFDTVENRVLVAALEAIARAGRVLRGPSGEAVGAEQARQIARIAREADHWRRHPRLTDVRGGRLNGRDSARLRRGNRSARMGAVLAVRARMREPFLGSQIREMADSWTRAYHSFVVDTLEGLRRHTPLPPALALSDGGLWTGAASFRHPAASGGSPPGLCFRGIPLLPPPELVDGAPWQDLLPANGIRITTDRDIDHMFERLGQRITQTQRGPSDRRAQRSESSSS